MTEGSEVAGAVGEVPGSERSVRAGPVGADSVDPLATSRQAAWGWRSNLDQFMPVVLFLVFYNLVNTEVAVLAATAWSVKAAYSRRRRGLPIGAWLPAITGYLLVRAAVSIAVERELVDFGVSSEAVYFGIGIGTKTLIGLAAAGTILAGRPFMVWAARRFVPLPEAVLRDPRFVSTMRNVTWVIAFYEVGSSIWDIWLYNNAGVNLFLITRQAVNFVTAFLLIFGTLLYVERRFQKIDGCPSLVELVGIVTHQKAGEPVAGEQIDGAQIAEQPVAGEQGSEERVAEKPVAGEPKTGRA